EYSTVPARTPVDLVVMSHVLEHVSAPRTFLANATSNLRKGGVVFIEVPCLDFEHKSIDEPHLLFFDKKPMHYLLSDSGFADIELGYYGREIERLQSASLLQSTWMSLRSLLISFGLVAPFARHKTGMEALRPIERAIIGPLKAHTESKEPAWWLRAVATKQ
ncbi:MAG: class I SAM-dependent methyltransferase, partial [Leptospira sp.]|nr:class I SAM-dependent methyltransferase [Leptospira sp.]